MSEEAMPARYAMLTTQSVVGYLRDVDAVVAILGEPWDSWTASERPLSTV